ncbi:MAG: hypothetical protein ACP5JE_03275 [Thermoplasmata archaeon]
MEEPNITCMDDLKEYKDNLNFADICNLLNLQNVPKLTKELFINEIMNNFENKYKFFKEVSMAKKTGNGKNITMEAFEKYKECRLKRTELEKEARQLAKQEEEYLKTLGITQKIETLKTDNAVKPGEKIILFKSESGEVLKAEISGQEVLDYAKLAAAGINLDLYKTIKKRVTLRIEIG